MRTDLEYQGCQWKHLVRAVNHILISSPHVPEAHYTIMVLFTQPPRSFLVILATGQTGRLGIATLTPHHVESFWCSPALGVNPARWSAGTSRTSGASAIAQLETCVSQSVTQLLLMHFPECSGVTSHILYFMERCYKYEQDVNIGVLHIWEAFSNKSSILHRCLCTVILF